MTNALEGKTTQEKATVVYDAMKQKRPSEVEPIMAQAIWGMDSQQYAEFIYQLQELLRRNE